MRREALRGGEERAVIYLTDRTPWESNPTPTPSSNPNPNPNRPHTLGDRRDAWRAVGRRGGGARCTLWSCGAKLSFAARWARENMCSCGEGGRGAVHDSFLR